MNSTFAALGIKSLGGRVRKGSCEMKVELASGRKLVIGGRTFKEACGLIESLFGVEGFCGRVRTRPDATHG